MDRMKFFESPTVAAEVAAAKDQFETFGKALKTQYQDFVKEKGWSFASLKKEACTTFTTAKEAIPPFPLMLFVLTCLVALTGVYVWVVSLPVDILSLGLHAYTDFVFFAAGGVGSLMLLYAFMVRTAAKYMPSKLNEMWEIPAYKWKSSRCYKHELYLSVPHIIAVGGMLLGVTFLEVVAACAYLPAYVAPPQWTAQLSASASAVLPAAAILCVLMILIRYYVPLDLFVLYSWIVSKPAYEAEFKKGTGKGALVCFFGFAIGMLFLDGALYKTGWEFKKGMGLPSGYEAELLPHIDFLVSLVKIFFLPVCFLGATAIFCTVKRGLYLYPEYGKPDSERKTTKPTYDEDAAAAYKAGTWEAFVKARKKRTFGLYFASTGVLLGVVVLIPIWGLAYVGSSTVSAACDVRGAENFINMHTNVGEVTKSVSDGLLKGGAWIEEKLGLEAPSFDVGLDELKKQYIDWEVACDTAEGVHFWTKTMLFGLLIHLPAAMTAWHLVNRYTMLMNVKDVLAGRVPTPAATSMV